MRHRIILIIIGIIIAALLLLWQTSGFETIQERPFVDDLLGNAEVAVKDSNTLEIVLVGDIMLSRYVGTKMEQAKSWTLPFDDLAFELARADITFGNLESPFLNSGNKITEGLVFKTEPEAVNGLIKAGFDVVSAANNHAFDQGITGLTFTKEWLRQHNILSIGTGTTTAEAWQPAVFEAANTKVAFLAASYASVNDGGRGRNEYVARIENEDFLRQAINQLRQEVDVIIVSMHAGEEYVSAPNEAQKNFAHSAIALGADIVVGHHPHWVQKLELYKTPLRTSSTGVDQETSEAREGLILYSLGNFIFDQGWSQKTKEGLMVRIIIKDKKLDAANLVPIIIDNYCCARLANDAESLRILRSINATSTINLRMP